MRRRTLTTLFVLAGMGASACSGGPAKVATAPGATSPVERSEGVEVVEPKIASGAILNPQPNFQPQCVTLGQPGQGVFDGEVLSDPPAMVFSDTGAGGSMWVARLDPKTGLFVSPTGRDQLVASDVTPLARIFNGGEWGKDRDGAAVYFTKPKEGVDQIWMAPLQPSGNLTAIPLTSGRERGSPMPRRDAAAASTQMLFIQDGYARGSLAVLDRKSPAASETTMTGVDKGMSGPRFIPATPDLVYATTDGQIARFRTSTGDSIILTNGGGRKGDPFAWSAPELGGATAVVAIEDESRIIVYSLNPDGTGLTAMRTIEMPPSDNPEWKGGEVHPWIYSLEPFTAGGRSYFSVHAQRDRVPPPRTTGSSVWVVSLDPIDGERMRMRLDDGKTAKRIDPEFLIGDNEVFVYFNVLEAPWKMMRCSTGIPVGASPTRDF